MDRDNAKPASLTFIAGLLTGGIIATLYAPKSGKDTRAEIKHKASQAQEEAKHKKDDIQDKFRRGLNEVRSKPDQQENMSTFESES